jgi:hypothetical protein
MSLTSLSLHRSCGGDLTPLTALRRLELCLAPPLTLADTPLPSGLTYLTIGGGDRATKEQIENFWGPPEASFYSCSRLEELTVGFLVPQAPNTYSHLVLRPPPYLTQLQSLRILRIGVTERRFDGEDDTGCSYKSKIVLPDLHLLPHLNRVSLCVDQAETGQVPAGCRVSSGQTHCFKFQGRFYN